MTLTRLLSAIGTGAERGTAEEVEAYIEERVPVQQPYPQLSATRSDALNSAIPALLGHISHTYPKLGVPSGEAGGAPGGGRRHGLNRSCKQYVDKP